MKKVLNVFNLRLIELVITIILSLFIWFGTLDEEVGLILNPNIVWLPLTLLVLLFIFALLELLYNKPYIRIVYLIIVLLTSISIIISDTFEVCNAAIWLLSVIYSPMIIVTLIKTKQENNIESNKSNTLPLGIFSNKVLYLNSAVLFISLLIVASILIFTDIISNNIGLFILIIIIYGVCLLAYFVYSSLKFNPVSKLVNKFTMDANYTEFENELNLLLKENLHEETRNYLNCLKVNYLYYCNKEKAIKDFESLIRPNSKMYTLQYDLCEISNYIFSRDISKALELIERFKVANPKYISLAQSFIHTIDLLDPNVFDINIENSYLINTQFKYINLANAFGLLEYYENRDNMDKAKYYAKFILDNPSDLIYINNKAQEVLNK